MKYERLESYLASSSTPSRLYPSLSVARSSAPVRPAPSSFNDTYSSKKRASSSCIGHVEVGEHGRFAGFAFGIYWYCSGRSAILRIPNVVGTEVRLTWDESDPRVGVISYVPHPTVDSFPVPLRSTVKSQVATVMQNEVRDRKRWSYSYSLPHPIHILGANRPAKNQSFPDQCFWYSFTLTEEFLTDDVIALDTSLDEQNTL